MDHDSKAEAIIERIRQRLIALAEKRAYRFVNTSRAAAEGYLNRKRLFVGWSPDQITAGEEQLAVQFPEVFRVYLRQMGLFHGDLFSGSDVVDPGQFQWYRDEATELLAESEAEISLPERAVVFLVHQGYTFVFLEANGGFDSPVYQYVEGEESWTQVAPGFAELLDGELSQMEANHRASLENGGYYVSIQNGYVSESYPALATGERPVDGPDQFID